MTFRLLQRPRQAGQRDTKPHHGIVFLAHDNRHQVITQHGDIHIHIIIDLLLRERSEAIQRSESGVECMEQRPRVRHNLFLILKFQHLQSIFLFHDLANPQMLLRHAIGNVNLELVPILVFPVTDALHLLGIIRIIVDGRHRAELVETLDQHSLVVHVGKTHRPVYLFHASLPRPSLDRAEQSVYHLVVIHKIDKTEPGPLLPPSLVAGAVDHPGDTSHYFPILIREEIDSVAHLERRIPFPVQRHHLFLY